MKNLILLFILCPIIAFSQPEDLLIRTPSLSPDGTQMAFGYEGDIWVSDKDGQNAKRLTIHESYESNPQWSPDGSQIVFVGDRHGNRDLFLITMNGSSPKRLTYHSTGDGSPTWGPGNTLYFTSRRTFGQLEREQEIHKLSANGGTPFRALDAMGAMPACSPNGRFIAFTRGSCRIAREAYTGPANRNIWLYDSQNKSYHQITKSDAQEIYPDWGDDGTLYFLSAENGRYNIHRQSIDPNGSPNGSAEAITEFSDEGIREFDVSANGAEIVFARGNGLFRQRADAGQIAKKLSVDIARDQRFYTEEIKTFTSSVTDYALSPNEKYIAFVVRGEIFVTENDKEKKRTVRITNHPYRDSDPQWLNDSTLLFLSDRDGNKDLFIARSSDQNESNLFETFRRKVMPLTRTAAEEEQFLISPDGEKIAIRKGRGGLVTADIDSKGNLTNEKTLLDGWDIAEGLTWSPDSRWLSYALEDLDFNEEIYIHPADNHHAGVNVSYHPRGDSNPVWSPDGSKLGFITIRNNGDADVWFVWLRKADWEKTLNDWEEISDDEDDDGKDKKKDKKSKKVDPIEIDFEDMHERLVQVTRLPGNEGNLAISSDGETFFFTTNGGGRQGSAGDPELMSVKWDGKDQKTIQSKANVRDLKLDKSGKSLYVLKRGGNIGLIKIEGGKSESRPIAAKMKIDYVTERQQIFDEGWRSLESGFYDPEFHGQDWNSLRRHYEPICASASTSQDFRVIFNEMLGQLNASHMGMSGGDPEETNNDRTGYLGIEGEMKANGFLVERVVPGTPADKTESKIHEGDIIKSIQDEELSINANMYALLNQTADERILLTVANSSGVVRDVIIRPKSSIRAELYRSWVKDRQALTDKYSGGKLGYIHIQGMNWPSFERFERELAASGQGKEGIVIDVRFNGGGWTTDMVMAVLNVRQHSYTIPRGAAKSLDKENEKFKEHYPYGERLPLSAWTRPSIALCNQNSYSNAEIFSHAYKELGHGTLVGTPTFGAVISTGSQGLIDGSRVRMPFRAWYVKATGKNMEHGPAVPDIIVENAPDSKAKGEDEQLKKAVEVLMGQINGKS